MNTKTCYCCDAKATSQEHAPPRCIFPELKDANGVDYRKNLITVPSCDVHNTAKSEDDEYFLSVLALNILNNEQGNDQAKSKVLRALKRSKKLAATILNKTTPVIIKDTITQKTEQTVAITIDTSKIENVVKQMALAIYYTHYKKKFSGNVYFVYESLMSLDDDNAVEINDHWGKFREASEAFFSTVATHGENRDIFVYQVYENPENLQQLSMRLKFYGENNFTIFFQHHP